jgi:hypothetical protein
MFNPYLSPSSHINPSSLLSAISPLLVLLFFLSTTHNAIHSTGIQSNNDLSKVKKIKTKTKTKTKMKKMKRK